MDGTVNSARYRDILDNNLWPVIAKHFGNKEYLFQELCLTGVRRCQASMQRLHFARTARLARRCLDRCRRAAAPRAKRAARLLPPHRGGSIFQHENRPQRQATARPDGTWLATHLVLRVRALSIA